MQGTRYAPILYDRGTGNAECMLCSLDEFGLLSKNLISLSFQFLLRLWVFLRDIMVE